MLFIILTSLLLVTFNSCSQQSLTELQHIEIKELDGLYLIKKAMFSSNNGFKNELYITFENENDKTKQHTLLIYIKDFTELLRQSDGETITASDIKPGMFVALYLFKEDFKSEMPKAVEARAIIILEEQYLRETPAFQKDSFNIENAVIIGIDNNYIQFSYYESELEKKIKAYTSNSPKYYTSDNIRISVDALSVGQGCTVYLNKAPGDDITVHIQLLILDPPLF